MRTEEEPDYSMEEKQILEALNLHWRASADGGCGRGA